MNLPRYVPPAATVQKLILHRTRVKPFFWRVQDMASNY